MSSNEIDHLMWDIEALLAREPNVMKPLVFLIDSQRGVSDFSSKQDKTYRACQWPLENGWVLQHVLERKHRNAFVERWLIVNVHTNETPYNHRTKGGAVASLRQDERFDIDYIETLWRYECKYLSDLMPGDCFKPTPWANPELLIAAFDGTTVSQYVSGKEVVRSTDLFVCDFDAEAFNTLEQEHLEEAEHDTPVENNNIRIALDAIREGRKNGDI